MKIQFERTGGFAGMKLAIDLDLESLPVDDASIIQKLIEAADLFHLELPPENQVMRDGFQYHLSIETEDNQCSFLMDDTALTDKLRPLVNELTLLARTNRRPAQ